MKLFEGFEILSNVRYALWENFTDFLNLKDFDELEGLIKRLLASRLVSVKHPKDVWILLTQVEIYGTPDDPSSHHLKRRQARALCDKRQGLIYAYSIFKNVCTNFTIKVNGQTLFLFLREGILMKEKEPVRVATPSIISSVLGVQVKDTAKVVEEVFKVFTAPVEVEYCKDRRVGVPDELKLRYVLKSVRLKRESV